MVKIIGWGEQNGIKYWIIENSWGSSWGENGFAKVKIGLEGSYLDNYGVTAEPVMPESS